MDKRTVGKKRELLESPRNLGSREYSQGRVYNHKILHYYCINLLCASKTVIKMMDPQSLFQFNFWRDREAMKKPPATPAPRSPRAVGVRPGPRFWRRGTATPGVSSAAAGERESPHPHRVGPAGRGTPESGQLRAGEGRGSQSPPELDGAGTGLPALSPGLRKLRWDPGKGGAGVLGVGPLGEGAALSSGGGLRGRPGLTKCRATSEVMVPSES